MNKFEDLITVRDGTINDAPFVLSTFLRGLYYGNAWFAMIPKHIFMQHYSAIVRALISSPKTIVKVACLPDDQDVIIGYSILSADYQTIHWVHVKKAWRQKGIATALTPRHPAFVSHLSDHFGKLLLSKLPNVQFNPFAI